MLQANEDGQSLIEVLVVGVVSAVMILALIMIILNSLKNAQFAQNQTQATKIAQDTIDRIRVLRDNNANNTLTTTTISECFIKLWDNTEGANFYCGIYDPINTLNIHFCYYDLIGSGVLNFLGNDDTVISLALTNINVLGTIFTRQIKISQPSNIEANIAVTISWTDSSGEHSSQLETIITKPNYECI